jgi:hypothetical protein
VFASFFAALSASAALCWRERRWAATTLSVAGRRRDRRSTAPPVGRRRSTRRDRCHAMNSYPPIENELVV